MKTKMILKKTKRTDEQNFYITNEMIYQEWLKWRDSADEVQDRTIPEQLALYVQQIARNITHTRSFSNYNDDLKDDLVSDALVKVFKNLKNMKEEKKDSFFNYISRTCYCSFYATLGKHYSYINARRKLTDEALQQMEPTIRNYAISLRAMLGLDDTEYC